MLLPGTEGSVALTPLLLGVPLLTGAREMGITSISGSPATPWLHWILAPAQIPAGKKMKYLLMCSDVADFKRFWAMWHLWGPKKGFSRLTSACSELFPSSLFSMPTSKSFSVLLRSHPCPNSLSWSREPFP